MSYIHLAIQRIIRDLPTLKPDNPGLCVAFIRRRGETAITPLTLETPKEQGIVWAVRSVDRNVPGEATRQRYVGKVWQGILDLEVYASYNQHAARGAQ